MNIKKMKPPPRTLYIRCNGQHPLNNRSEVSPKKFQENAINNLYLNTQPKDHDNTPSTTGVRSAQKSSKPTLSAIYIMNISPNKKICNSSKFKGKLFLSPKGKKQKYIKYAIPKSFSRKQIPHPPTSLKVSHWPTQINSPQLHFRFVWRSPSARGNKAAYLGGVLAI